MRIVFHLLPIVPLFYTHYFLTAAVVLAVLLPYIKNAKMSRQLRNLGNDDSGSEMLEEEKASLAKAIDRWRALTFLPEIEKWNSDRKNQTSTK